MVLLCFPITCIRQSGCRHTIRVGESRINSFLVSQVLPRRQTTIIEDGLLPKRLPSEGSIVIEDVESPKTSCFDDSVSDFSHLACGALPRALEALRFSGALPLNLHKFLW